MVALYPFSFWKHTLPPFPPFPHIYHGNLDKLLDLQLTIGTVLSTRDCVSKVFNSRAISAQPLTMYCHSGLSTPVQSSSGTSCHPPPKFPRLLQSPLYSSWLPWAQQRCSREHELTARGMFGQEEIRKAGDTRNRDWSQKWGKILWSSEQDRCEQHTAVKSLGGDALDNP